MDVSPRHLSTTNDLSLKPPIGKVILSMNQSNYQYFISPTSLPITNRTSTPSSNIRLCRLKSSSKAARNRRRSERIFSVINLLLSCAVCNNTKRSFRTASSAFIYYLFLECPLAVALCPSIVLLLSVELYLCGDKSNIYL